VKDNAIIFDINGTAIYSPEQKLPSEKLVSVIEQLKDAYYLSAATGRVWSFAKHVLHGLHLTDSCIISAGTYTYHGSVHPNMKATIIVQ
jgi:hydroxymethylpyrimidine pyrophosphatase-like HAD family hydrolase